MRHRWLFACVHLLINLSEPFFRHDRRTAPKFGTHVWIQTRLALTKKNWPTPPQRGLGVIYWCLWVECLWVAWFKPVVDRKLLERLMSPSPKSQVMFASAFSWIGDFFSNFWDSYFSSYGEFDASLSLQAYSLDGTTAVLSLQAVAVFTKKAARRRGLWTSLALLQWAAGRVR